MSVIDEVVRWVQLHDDEGALVELGRQRVVLSEGEWGTNLNKAVWRHPAVVGDIKVVGFTVWDSELDGKMVTRPGSIPGRLIPEGGTLTFPERAMNVVDLFEAPHHG